MFLSWKKIYWLTFSPIIHAILCGLSAASESFLFQEAICWRIFCVHVLGIIHQNWPESILLYQNYNFIRKKLTTFHYFDLPASYKASYFRKCVFLSNLLHCVWNKQYGFIFCICFLMKLQYWYHRIDVWQFLVVILQIRTQKIPQECWNLSVFIWNRGNKIIWQVKRLVILGCLVSKLPLWPVLTFEYQHASEKQLWRP